MPAPTDSQTQTVGLTSYNKICLKVKRTLQVKGQEIVANYSSIFLLDKPVYLSLTWTHLEY